MNSVLHCLCSCLCGVQNTEGAVQTMVIGPRTIFGCGTKPWERRVGSTWLIYYTCTYYVCELNCFAERAPHTLHSLHRQHGASLPTSREMLFWYTGGPNERITGILKLTPHGEVRVRGPAAARRTEQDDEDYFRMASNEVK